MCAWVEGRKKSKFSLSSQNIKLPWLSFLSCFPRCLYLQQQEHRGTNGSRSHRIYVIGKVLISHAIQGSPGFFLLSYFSSYIIYGFIQQLFIACSILDAGEYSSQRFSYCSLDIAIQMGPMQRWWWYVDCTFHASQRLRGLAPWTSC